MRSRLDRISSTELGEWDKYIRPVLEGLYLMAGLKIQYYLLTHSLNLFGYVIHVLQVDFWISA